MVNNDVSYELFCLSSTNRLTQLKKQHNIFAKQVEQIVNWVDKEKNNVYKFTTRTEFLNETYIPNKEPLSSFEKYLNIQYDIYKKAKANCVLYNNEYKRVQKENMNRFLFNKIIKKINTKIGDSIINNNYKFYNHLFGILCIDFVRSKHKMVDWNKSNNNKKRLIEEGKEIYSKEKEQEAKNLNVEYKGEQYLEFHSLNDLKITWDRTKGSKLSLPNLANYDFRPSSKLIKKVAKMNQELNVAQRIAKYNIKPYNYETA